MDIQSFPKDHGEYLLMAATETGFKVTEEAGPFLLLRHETEPGFLAILVEEDAVTAYDFTEDEKDEFMHEILKLLPPEDLQMLADLAPLAERYPAIAKNLPELATSAGGKNNESRQGWKELLYGTPH